MKTRTRWRVGVDTGGTFTDLILLGDDGRMLRRKVLSTPDDFSRGILQNAYVDPCHEEMVQALAREIPNNSGFLRLLHVKAPAGSIVNMAFPAA